MDTTVLKGKFAGAQGLPKRSEVVRVEDLIGDLCDSLRPGDRIPAHKELMLRFNASERTVLRALEEMVRAGRIVRRSGSGTYVSDVVGRRNGRVGTLTDSHDNAIVAIALQDGGFFETVVEKLKEYAETAEIDVVTAYTTAGSGMRAVMSHVRHPRGFIVFSSALARDAQRLYDAGHRVVQVGGVSEPQNTYPVVYSDSDHAGYVAAKHLIDLGHDRIIYVHDDSGAAHSPRIPGMERAIREVERRGRRVSLSLMHPDLYNPWLTDSERLRDVFASGAGPTGVIAWNDTEALAIITALKQANIDVPGEVSVIGHDNLPVGESSSPKLTTVDSAIHLQLKYALDLLTQPELPTVGSKLVIVPSLVVRESTAPPRLSRLK